MNRPMKASQLEEALDKLAEMHRVTLEAVTKHYERRKEDQALAAYLRPVPTELEAAPAAAPLPAAKIVDRRGTWARYRGRLLAILLGSSCVLVTYGANVPSARAFHAALRRGGIECVVAQCSQTLDGTASAEVVDRCERALRQIVEEAP